MRSNIKAFNHWHELPRIEAQDLGLRWTEMSKEGSVFHVPIRRGEETFGSLTASTTRNGKRKFAAISLSKDSAYHRQDHLNINGHERHQHHGHHNHQDQRHDLIEIVQNAGNFCIRCPVCKSLRKKLYLNADTLLSQRSKTRGALLACDKCLKRALPKGTFR